MLIFIMKKSLKIISTFIGCLQTFSRPRPESKYFGFLNHTGSIATNKLCWHRGRQYVSEWKELCSSETL